MKKAILRSHGREADWSEWRIVWLLSEHQNTWKIWSGHWEDIFTRYIHKNTFGERIEPL